MKDRSSNLYIYLIRSNKSERGKGPWRGNKSKTPAFPQDLYLLGPKGTTKPDKTDTKRTTVTVPTKAVASASQSLSGNLF